MPGLADFPAIFKAEEVGLLLRIDLSQVYRLGRDGVLDRVTVRTSVRFPALPVLERLHGCKLIPLDEAARILGVAPALLLEHGEAVGAIRIADRVFVPQMGIDAQRDLQRGIRSTTAEQVAS